MNSRSDRQNKIIDEAAEWFALMQQDTPADADIREFADWLASSAEHIREYLHIGVLSGMLAEIPDDQETAEIVGAGLRAENGNVINMPGILRSQIRRRKAKVRHRRMPAGKMAVFALVTAAISATTIFFANPWLNASPPKYETGTGEQVSFPLDDGTVMTLNTQSKVRITFDENYRDVILLNGEALFDVVKDTVRPFRVITGKAVISAVGTSFNVHHRNDATVVTVVEGEIELRTNPQVVESQSEPSTGSRAQSSPVRLTIGQQARVEAGSGRVAILETNIANVTAWRQRRLVFNSRPLASAVEEFNLYNDAAIRIGDSHLNAVEVGGVFSANERHSFAMFLKEAGLADIQIADDDTITLVEPRSPDP